MVRCSKAMIVQLIAFLAVIGLLNFYLASTEAESAEENLSHDFSDRGKFRSSDTGHEVRYSDRVVTESAYKLTTHGPETNEIHNQLKMANELLLKEQQRLKELNEERKKEEQRLKELEEEKEKEEQRLKELDEEMKNKEQRLNLEELEEEKKKNEQRLEELEEEKKKEEQRLKELDEEKKKEEQRLKELEDEKKKEEQEKLKKEQEQKQKDELKSPQSAEQTILERMARVKDVCKRLNYPNSNQYNMYHFRKYGGHGISWCPTFKASSSTWRDFYIDNVLGSSANFMGVHYHLGVLGNQILQRSANRGSSSTRKRTFIGESEESVRFTVVRHPISRLISHLRKAQNYPYEVRAQRGDWVEESIMDGRTDPSWNSATRDKYKREWDKYLDEIGSKTNHASFSENNPYLHPPYPVFPELINFVMKHRARRDDKGNNGHWRPTIEWCDICQNDLDIIIQLEKEPEELLYLLEKLGMSPYKEKFLSKHNSSSNRSASKDEIKEYVKQLNAEQVNYLNKMYAADFEMLGYDPIVVK